MNSSDLVENCVVTGERISLGQERCADLHVTCIACGSKAQRNAKYALHSLKIVRLLRMSLLHLPRFQHGSAIPMQQRRFEHESQGNQRGLTAQRATRWVRYRPFARCLLRRRSQKLPVVEQHKYTPRNSMPISTSTFSMSGRNIVAIQQYQCQSQGKNAWGKMTWHLHTH